MNHLKYIRVFSAVLLVVCLSVNVDFAQIPSSYTRLSVNALNLNRTGTKMTTGQLTDFGPAYKGYRWNSGDEGTLSWRPQGITGYEKSGQEWSLVSWYGRNITGTVGCNTDYRDRGSRVSFVNITDMNSIQYRHVLLVDELGQPFYDMHAGGLAIIGDTLYTVDSRGSTDAVYAFCLDSIIEIPSADQGLYYGYQYILPKLPDEDLMPFNPSFISYDRDDQELVVGSFQNCPSNNCPTPENNRLIWFESGDVDRNSNFYDGLFGKMQGLASATNLNNSNKKDIWVSTSYGSGNNSRLYYFSYDIGINTSQNQSIDLSNNYAYISISPGLEDMYRAPNDDIWTLSEFSGNWPCITGSGNVRSVVVYSRSALTPPGSCNGNIVAELHNETNATICSADTLIYTLPVLHDVSCIDFDPGAGDGVWVEANSLAALLAGNSRSVFMWVKQSSTISSEAQTLFGINTSTGGNVSLLNVGTNEKLVLYDGATSHNGTTTITDGNWHHVGYTYDEVTGASKLYVDGVVEVSINDIQAVSSSDLISFGQEFDSGLTQGNYSECRMTEVSIWDAVLSPSDIALIAGQPVESDHPKITNLVAHYNGNKNCGDDLTHLEDVSGNGYHAKLYGEIGANGIEAQTVSDLDQIPNFNSVSYFAYEWLEGGNTIFTNDTLELIAGQANSGNYQLKLQRGPFVFEDNWSLQFNVTTGIDVQGACGSYTWIDGENYTVSSNSATHILPNSFGCDSIVTLDLTILPTKIGSEASTICHDGSIVVNGTTFDASNPTGTEVFTNVGPIGCDSTVTINLNVLPAVDISTSTSDVTIMANATGVTYRWLDCDNGNVAIAGGTNQSFTATTNGNYAVVIDDGVCSDTSACVNINSVGIDVLNTVNDVVVYPNPSSGLFTLDISDLKDVELIQILGVQGKLVYRSSSVNNSQLEVDLTNSESGMYTLIIQTSEAEYRKKLIKQ